MKLKSILLLSFILAAIGAKASTPLFADDFEWLEPWASQGAGKTVETGSTSESAPQLGTYKVDGKSTYEALLEKGYTFPICCAPGKSARQPNAQVYLQRNYLKFGLTGYYSGISFPVDATSAYPNTDYSLSFKWCPMKMGNGEYDAIKLVVIVKTDEGETTYNVPDHGYNAYTTMDWIPVSFNIGSLSGKVQITVRNADEQWPDESAKAYRWFIDDIKVDEAPSPITFSPESLDILLGKIAGMRTDFKLNPGVALTAGAWSITDESIAEIKGQNKSGCDVLGKKVGTTELNYEATLSNGRKLSATASINVKFGVGSEFTVGDFTYTVLDENEAALSRCNIKENVDVTLSDKVNYEGKDYAVNKIYESAFSGCPIKSVVIPESIDNIGYGAFAYCNMLEKINLPSKLKEIAPYLFQYCTKLTEIKLPAGIEKIGDYAFRDAGLTSIELPAGVKSIGNYAFLYSKFTSIILPENLTNIGNSAFRESKLTSIILPENIATIGNYVFEANKDLTSIVIGKNVSQIGNCILRGCSSLKEIKVAEGNQWYTVVDGMLLTADKETLKAYPEGNGETVLTLPSTVRNSDLSLISSTSKIETVIFPEGMEVIPKMFSSAKNLKTVKLPSSTKSITGSAFSFCSNIRFIYSQSTEPPVLNMAFEEHYQDDKPLLTWYTVYVPKGCVDAYKASEWGSFTDNIFDDENVETNFTVGDFSYTILAEDMVAITDGTKCEGDVKIGNTVTYKDKEYLIQSIYSRAFMYSKIKSISLPASITSIGNEAFAYCSQLEKVALPSGLKSISYAAFEGCSKLTDISFPSSLEKIGNEAFAGSGITTLNLPTNLESIGDVAFSNCQSLTTISIGKNVNSIGWTILGYCPSLAEIKVDAANKWYTEENGMLLTADKSILKAYALANEAISIVIPAAIKEVEQGVFEGAKFISVTFTEGMEIIPNNICYNWRELETVKLPSTAKEIQGNAFVNCNKIKTIYSAAIAPPTIRYPINDTYFTIAIRRGDDYVGGTLWVPKGCVSAYKESNWGNLTDNILEEGSGVEDIDVDNSDEVPVMYDLYGRRISNPVPGHIYIINGKKVLVR